VDTRQVIDYWLSDAKLDITVAEHLYASEDYLYCLFICHLFVEKTLKALVVGKTGQHAPPIHNLVLLAKAADVSTDERQDILLRDLMRFNIESRYPKDREALRRSCDKGYALAKLEEAKEFRKWLEKKIR